MYDYLIIGAGLFGAVAARRLTDAGFRCFILERRDHVGGLCYTRQEAGLTIHGYGPHIFHTPHETVWRFVTRFAEFFPYRHTGQARIGNRLWSFPINLQTLHQLWGVTTPAEAADHLARVREPIAEPANLEDWCLAHLGRDLYELFIRGYTKKQWQCDPRTLPAAIVQRLPVRTTANDAYFDDPYQGIPVAGYTALFHKLLEGIPVELGVDYLAHRTDYNRLAPRILYTGPLDAFFNHSLGPLAYRTLRFATERLDLPDFQGHAIVTYPEESVPFTRIVEHKHFVPAWSINHTLITREYPQPWHHAAEPYYPLNDAANNRLYDQYAALARRIPGVLFGGRLGLYRYLNMDQVVALALDLALRELASRTARPRLLSAAPVRYRPGPWYPAFGESR